MYVDKRIDRLASWRDRASWGTKQLSPPRGHIAYLLRFIDIMPLGRIVLVTVRLGIRQPAHPFQSVGGSIRRGASGAAFSAGRVV